MFLAPPFNGAVEFSPSFSPRPQISHIVFDFDGTLSWLRHGWPQIMCTLFEENFPAKRGESEATIRELLLNEIYELNGKQSIFQMERFAQLVRERRGTPPHPEDLLLEYQRRLDKVIYERSEQITRGEAKSYKYVVHGALALLDKFQQRGLKLIILSGTIEHRVKQEAELLELARYFTPHIYGSKADPAQFSKRMVLNRVLKEEGISGHHLLSIGDGPVEIVQTKELGGVAVGVATDEEQNGSGKMEPHKRHQLLKAGADILIPDFRDTEALLQSLFENR
ncbi:MAG: Haloacid dehalogenase domain protein hydrolase [Pedosphaera sp.]|nr:Haloacid dehalogenase domain protein hydrolase [Pedosphaera sp.]